jgi:acetyl esterase/lipase
MLSAESIFSMTLGEVQALIDDKIMQTDGMKVEVESVHERIIKKNGRNTPVRIYYPSQKEGLPLIVFIHGGAWVAGSLQDTCKVQIISPPTW